MQASIASSAFAQAASGAPGPLINTQQSPPLASAPVAPAGADVGTASGGAAENIVVTGSRLKQSNATSETPVVIVTAAQIEHTQAQTLEDALTKLPEIGTSGLYSTTNNGGGGVSCIELRNLGLSRTLVLVDGKRFVNGPQNCVDLNNIPLEQVERIEILKDGASTTYGADAIAGVVNIILKHNYSGVVFHANGQIATQAGDDKSGELSVLAGTNFDHGNFTLGLDYDNQGPVSQADRSFAQYPVQPPFKPLGKRPTVGSIYNGNGYVQADPNNLNMDTFNNLGNVVNQNGSLGAVYTGARSQRFNFGALQDLSGSLEKESITSTANYDFNDHITGFAEAFFTHKKTGQQLAPQPASGALPGTGFPDAFVVPEGNPGLTALLGPGSGPVDLLKRELQFGNRQYSQVDNTFQINTGFKGDIGAGWNYEVFFQYGEYDDQTLNTSNINFLHVENEVGFQQTIATPAQQAAIIAQNGGFDATTFGIYNPAQVCLASAGCTIANPFGKNLTAAQVAYATYTEAQQNRETLKIYGGNISNNEVYQLPAGPVGVSLGVEHRTETGKFTPDSLDLTGEGLGSTARPTNGSFSVTEVYGETRIPILKDLPGAKDLHVDVGGRFFDYNNFGSGETWKVSGNYTPIEGIRFRGSDGVAFRQPSINDLFTGQLISFNGAIDPCTQVSNYGGKAGIVQANCAKQGVNTTTFVQNGSQVQAIVGGNPALTPETARTQTFGVVATPPFIPRLALTVDFSRTKINNTIGILPTQFILDNCYTQANFNPGTTVASDPCSLVSQRAGTKQLSTITQINENLGVTRTEAIDFGLTYSHPLAGYGTLSFQNDLTLTLKYQQQSVQNGPFIGYLNTIGVQASSLPAFPRYRDNASVNWRFGDFQLGYTLRFIEGTVFDTYPAPFIQGKLKGQYASAATPDVFYHDINGSYDYHNISLNLGVQNLFNKQPPFVYDTATNTDAAVYDIFGRIIYLKTTLRF